MKAYAITIAIGLFAFISNASFGQTYTINKKHNELNWKGYSEVGGYVQEGTIAIKSSSVSLDESGKVSGEITMDMSTISNEDADLEAHLKNEDFFDVEKFPEATMSFSENANGEVTGELVIKGVTGELIMTPKIEKKGDQLMVSGASVIDRTIYGIKYNSSSYFQDLGSYAIKNNFDLTFELVYDLK